MGKGKKANRGGASPQAAPAALPWWRAWAGEGIAWGLAVVILLRPLRDGLTFRTDNFYYLWILALLFALYLARVLLRGQVIRVAPYIALAAAFPVVALALSPATIQGDGTYRTLLMWFGHIALFMMVADGLRTRLAVTIVTGAFMLASLNEAFWSILHYEYVLPSLRRMINENPAVLGQYFGAQDLTPLLRDRLETNRAFGHFLFPNALSAFLIVAIPYAAASVWPAWRDARTAWRSRAGEPAGSEVRLHRAALIGLVSWFTAFALSAAFFPFFLYHWTGDRNWLGRPVLCVVFIGLLPLVLAAGPYIIARIHGARTCGLVLRAVFYPILLLCQTVALYLTFSRGGTLAVILSMCVGIVFLFLAWGGRLERLRPALAALLAMGLVMLAVTAMPSLAQEAPASVSAPEAAAAEPAAPQDDGLSISGRDLTARDIVNPASFFLRITYWKVAWDIAKDYWLTGVGLGNFSTIYPVYQYLGAGDVQAAHNDYLQYLCETGVPGLLAFIAFWAFLLFNGARRVLAIENRTEQIILTSMLAGMLAFLLHALVDFPFVNPSLAFFQYLLAGLFLARMGLQLPERQNHNLHRMVAGILLVTTAFAVGASMRVYISDYLLGGRTFLQAGSSRLLQERAQALKFLMESKTGTATPGPGDPHIQLGSLVSLIPRLDSIQSFGAIRIPMDSGSRSLRAPAANEVVPLDARVFITDPARAHEEGVRAAHLWLDELERLDGLYPKNSELALYMVGMHIELMKASTDHETQMRYSLSALHWAEEAISRNPMQSVCWQYYGLALTYRGNLERTTKALDYYEKMLNAYKKATELYPIGHIHWRQYADATGEVAKLVKRTDPQRSAALLKESQEARERSLYIERYRTEYQI